MFGGHSLSLLTLVFGVVLFGGLAKGLVGFGYAIASTAILATILGLSTAVVAMILPMLVANLALLADLDAEGFRRCVVWFWPYVTAAMVGTLVGILALDTVPQALLAGVMGL